MKVRFLLLLSSCVLILLTGYPSYSQSPSFEKFKSKVERSTQEINNQATEIDRLIVWPKGLSRDQLRQEVWLYFAVSNERATDFRPLEFEKEIGLTRLQYAQLLIAMSDALKQVKIKIPKDPVGEPPYWLVLKVSAKGAAMNVVIEAPPQTTNAES